jgi:hypothetical protein
LVSVKSGAFDPTSAAIATSQKGDLSVNASAFAQAKAWAYVHGVLRPSSSFVVLRT